MLAEKTRCLEMMKILFRQDGFEDTRTLAQYWKSRSRISFKLIFSFWKDLFSFSRSGSHKTESRTGSILRPEQDSKLLSAVLQGDHALRCSTHPSETTWQWVRAHKLLGSYGCRSPSPKCTGGNCSRNRQEMLLSRWECSCCVEVSWSRRSADRWITG